MKKINLLIVFIVSLALLSCSEDNVDLPSAIQTDNQFPIPDAEFIINGTDYSISNGYIFTNGICSDYTTTSTTTTSTTTSTTTTPTTLVSIIKPPPTAPTP